MSKEKYGITLTFPPVLFQTDHEKFALLLGKESRKADDDYISNAALRGGYLGAAKGVGWAVVDDKNDLTKTVKAFVWAAGEIVKYISEQESDEPDPKP